jgi:hypothetical protein
MAKAALELIEPSRQPPEQRPRAVIEHRRAAYRIPAESTMSSIPITRRISPEIDDLTKSY